MSHRRFERTLTVKAQPLPCSGRRLQCVWREPEKVSRLVDNYRLTSIYLDDGATAIMVEPRVLKMDAAGFVVELPDQCWEIANRQETRIACDNVPIQIIQNSMLFRGVLCEFSTGSFLVELDIKPPQTYQCLDPAKPLNLIVYDRGDLIYSGDFKILKLENSRRPCRFTVTTPESIAVNG